MRQAFSSLLIVCAVGLVSHAQPRTSRVLELGELRFPQIDALDRERTMFVLPIGMLEEHGPHLPIASDTFGVMFEAEGVATRVSRELPQWTVVMMPPLHYGETDANEIGGVSFTRVRMAYGTPRCDRWSPTSAGRSRRTDSGGSSFAAGASGSNNTCTMKRPGRA